MNNDFTLSTGSARSNKTATTTAADVVEAIRSGAHKDQVRKVRDAIKRNAPDEEIRELKKAIPGVLWSGTFKKRDARNLIAHSGLLCADIDKIGLREQAEDLRDRLREDPHVACAFVSPSGTGTKAVFRVSSDPSKHLASFLAVQTYMREKYSVEIDTACKDVARLCFLSFDPGIWWKEATALPIDDAPAPVKPAPAEEGVKQGERNSTAFDLARRLRDQGVGQDDALHQVQAFAAKCMPPLPTDEVQSVINSAYSRPPAPRLTLRRPGEFLEMQFKDDDVILGDRLLAVGQSLVIAAAGGMGKSRLLLQLAAAVVSGRKFLGLPTGGANQRWLILQTENSNRRLKADMARLKAWLGRDWDAFNERVVIHTLENDIDGFMSLESEDNVEKVQAAISDARADVVCIDPLNDFGIGDLNQDFSMKETVQTLARVCRRGNPLRSLVVVHHARTGKIATAGAVGFDRSSFARNSKVLFGWARGQINLAPIDPDSNDRLIVSCAKCSNGREFKRFGIRLDPATMIYNVDPSFNEALWREKVDGEKRGGPIISMQEMRDLCAIPKDRKDLAQALAAWGYSGKAGYNRIDKWIRAGALKEDKRSGKLCLN